MEKKPHVALTGPRGAGKTYIVSRLMAELKCPLYGYMTKNLATDETGFHPIYIHPASTPVERRVYSEANLIGTCNTRIHNINSAVFDDPGAGYITSAKSDGVIIMDEIGFMESASEKFTSAVLNALDGDIPVIATVKKMDGVDFIDRVKGHPRLKVFEVTRETSESVYREVKEYLGI